MACMKAIRSRQAVELPTAPGSCSYEDFRDMGEDAFKLFKATRNKKHRFTSPVKRAIVSPSEFCTSLEFTKVPSEVYLCEFCCKLLSSALSLMLSI